jgi:hypothetical protein
MPMLSNSPNHFLASLSTTDGDLLRPHLKSLTLAQGAFVYIAAREFAAKVMRGLLRNQDEDWRGWTMEVRLDGRWVWHLPFDAIPRATSH